MFGGGERRAHVAGVLATLICLLALVGATVAAADPGDTVLVDVDPNGSPETADSENPTISADGRYVAFESELNDLSPNDNDSSVNVFRRDLQTGTTTLVDVDPNGSPEVVDSAQPAISGDGRYVAFVSGLDDLSTDDNNAATNVFVRDLQNQTTTLVDVDPNGSPDTGSSYDPSISADGNQVAFASELDDLSTDDNNSGINVFVRNIASGTTTLVNVDPNGSPEVGTSRAPSISADGQRVAFGSSLDDLSEADNDASSNVFVRNLAANTTTLVNVDPNGSPETGTSGLPAISGDGTHVAFESDLDDLSTADNNASSNIFVRDLGAATTTLANVDPNGSPETANSFDATIDETGRLVGFDSQLNDLSPDDNDSVTNVFVRDTVAQTTTLANVDPGATPELAGSEHPALSSDGDFVAFYSDMDDLATGDNNSARNVFRTELGTASPPDTEAKGLKLGGKTTQKAGGAVTVDATARVEPLFVSAKGKITISRTKGTLKLGAASKRKIATGRKSTLRLKLSSRLRKKVEKALDKHRTVKAKIDVSASDEAGNADRASRTVKLK